MTYEQEFVAAFLKTQAVELPVVWGLVRWLAKWRNGSSWTVLSVAFMATALTLPYLWFILPGYLTTRAVYVGVGESLVTVVEAVVYRQGLNVGWGEALILSLAANAASVAVGWYW